MKRIIFHTLTIRNFLSFGDIPQTISFQQGVNGIVGINYDKEDSQNGAGKSSILEALYFALYGNTIRDINKELIVNSQSKKNCVVELEFDVCYGDNIDRYRIYRSISPSKCFLYKNNDDITLSTQIHTNEEIQKIIRTLPSVFKNSVIMSVNSTEPFMGLSKIDKQKYIENVLSLDIFSKMLQKAKDEHSSLRRDYDVTFSEFKIKSQELDFLNQQVIEFKQKQKERLSQLQDDIEKFSRDISDLKQKIEPSNKEKISELSLQLKKFIETLEEKQKAYQNNELKSKEIETRIHLEEEQINKLKINQNICPTCHREFDDKHKHVIGEEINQKNQNIKKLKEQLKDCQSTSLLQQINNLKKEIEKLQEQIEQLKNQEIQNLQIVNTIERLQSNRKLLLQEKQKLESEENNNLNERYNKIKNDTRDLQNKISTLNEELKIIETVRKILSEDGVKAFIVKKVLKVLNNLIQFYLHKLNANCLCEFDEFFREKIIDENQNVRSYYNFSGGERKRIDLACLFAFADIRRLQGDVVFETVFYDELLDSSLDTKGVHQALQILQERFLNFKESCYIVTHRKDALLDVINSMICVEKHNGISYISV